MSFRILDVAHSTKRCLVEAKIQSDVPSDNPLIHGINVENIDIPTYPDSESGRSNEGSFLQLDDDLIIHALNDKPLISDSDGDDPFSADALSGYGNCSDDEIKIKALSKLRADESKTVTVNKEKDKLRGLTVDELTNLGRVHSILLSISKFKPTSLSSGLEYTIEAEFPKKDGILGTMKTSAKLKRHRFEIASNIPDLPIEVNFEETCSLNFGNDLLECWLTEAIVFKVTATFPNVPKTGSKSQSEWIGTGQIPCRNLLTSHSWSGKVPIWNVKEAPEGRLLGTLEVKIDLVSQCIPSNHVAAPNPNAKENPTQNVQVESSIPQNDHKSHLSKELIYFYLNISTLRSQTLSNLVGPSAVLSYLSLRLHSLGQPLESPPIIVNSTFDKSSGKLNPPSDFNFHFTIPMSEWLSESDERSFLLVIEIWYLVNSNSAGKDSLVEDKGPSLLGLVKLPYHYLMKTATNEATSLPVVWPDTEYAVNDPFTGKSLGWLKATMFAGLLKDATVFRKEKESSKLIANTLEKSSELKQVEQRVDRELIALLKETLTLNRPPGKEAKEIDLQAKVGGSYSQLNESETNSQQSPSREHHPSRRVVLSVSIIKACGLKPLLTYVRKELMDREMHYGALDYALERGVNAQVKFTLFPLVNSNNHEIEKESTIEARAADPSFTPQFDSLFELEIEDFDAELLKWIQEDGVAKGEVWHTEHDHQDLKSFLLGSFDLHLKDLLSHPQGISQRWVKVAAKNHELPDFGAIQLSVKFQEGFDLGEIPIALGTSHFDINVSISDVYIRSQQNSAMREVTPQLRLLPAKLGEGTQLPLMTLVSDKIGFRSSSSVSEKLQISVTSHQLNDSLNLIVDFYSSHFLGSSEINLLGLLNDARKSSRKRQTDAVSSLTAEYPIVNGNSVDLLGARTTISISVCRSNPSASPKPSRHFVQLHNKTASSDSTKLPDQKTDVPKIELTVKIERAMQLQHVRDPLTMDSPFVKSSEEQLAFPSPQVTFDWPKVNGKRFSTSVVPNQVSPKWGEVFSLSIDKTLESLKGLKNEGCLNFKIWSVFPLAGQKSGSMDFLAECKVDLAPLFFGIEKIEGWYPVYSIKNGTASGQLLVQIYSGESLRLALEGLRPNVVAASRSLNVNAVPLSPASTRPPLLAKTLSNLPLLSKSSIESFSKTNIRLSNSQTADTWIWSGNRWEHKNLGSPPAESPKIEAADRTSIFKKTIRELDDLQSKLKQISSSPKDKSIGPALLINVNGFSNRTDPVKPSLELDRMDHILRISRCWTPDDMLGIKPVSPLTLEDLNGDVIDKKDQAVIYFFYFSELEAY